MKYGIYHKDCEDGAMSAVILKKAVPDIRLIAVKPNEWSLSMTPANEGDAIYFVDVCPSPELLIDITRRKITWTVIDHHITAKQQIDAYKQQHAHSDFSSYHYYPDNCGATGAWLYFFKDTKQPELLKFIEINDTWKWDRDVNSKFVDQYMKTICKRGDISDYTKLLDSFDYEEAVEKGKLLYLKLMNDVNFIVEKAVELDFDGHKVLTLNTPQNIDQTANLLATKSPSGVGVCYHIYPGDGYVKFSARGIKGDAARKLAEHFGGGGHDKSSAFTMTIDAFYELLKKNKK